MIYILTAVTTALAVAIVCLSIGYARTKRAHEQKVGALNAVIAELLVLNKHQIDQLRLSDELKEKLAGARLSIDRDVLAVQSDLVAVLSKNGSIE
jgi:hypothetical protein